MEKERKKILIVSYVFPPFPGIGGRRWAKFAKELALRNYQVFVIAARNPMDIKSQWNKDIQYKNISVIYLPTCYPKSLLQAPQSFFDKIAYKTGVLFNKLKTKGNHYDRTMLWKKQLLSTIDKLVRKEKIDTVIVSAPPYHYLYFLAQYKEKFNNIKLIVDFRDPWTDNPGKSFAVISEKRKSIEYQREGFTIKKADIVMSVSEEMNQYLINRYSVSPEKFYTVPNGYDKDDIIDCSHQSTELTKIKFILAGTLYQKVSEHFYALIEVLKELKLKEPEIYASFQFDFYGDTQQEYVEKVTKEGIDNIMFHSPIPLLQVHEKLCKSHIGMLFLQDHLTFSFSTKFYEYIGYRKKIAVFSKPGKTGEFVEANNIGYHLTLTNMKEKLKKIHADFQNNNITIPDDFDIERFSTSKITDKIEELISR